jgi:hypothetical protein
LRRTTTLLLLLLPAILLAGNGGSSYSIYGVGDLRTATGVRSAGMGYTGIGLADIGYINALAPGTWARLNRARLEASLLYEGFSSTDGAHNRYLSRADFNGALLAVPISQPNGIVMVAGIVPFSTVNYDAYTLGQYIGPQDTMAYAIHHVGTGGITRGIVGLSYAPSQKLALGFSTNVLFGSIDRETVQSPRSSAYTGGVVTDRVTANGVTFSLGALYTGLGDLHPSLRPLSLGAVVTSRGILTARNLTHYAFTTSESTTERDTSEEVTRQSTVPLALGIGLGYRLGERYLLAADYQRQLWSGATINDAEAATLRDSYRIGIGAERLPNNDIHSGFREQLALRLGAFYHATYYQPQGYPIDEWGVTAGAGVPLSGESRLNFALEYTRRAGDGPGMIKDSIIRLSVSANISALWFIQYPEE